MELPDRKTVSDAIRILYLVFIFDKFCARENSLGTDSGESCQFSGQCVDRIGRRVDDNTDDIETAFFIGDSESTDNRVSVIRKDGIDSVNALVLFDDDSDDGNSSDHASFLSTGSVLSGAGE
jgi:hypothetical protein